MGHSDAQPLQTALQATSREVQVWGDMDAAVVAGDGHDAAPDAPPPHPEEKTAEDFYHRIGHLTRTLHDALHALGYQESLVIARDKLPDARDRLAYIARLTGDAAEKVLNSVDRARGVQDGIAGRADVLQKRWEAVHAYAARGERATPAGLALIDDTRAFLAGLAQNTGDTNAILTEIMMAQDFHDLTGQVIRRVVDLAQTLEEQLVRLLVEAKPAEVAPAPETAQLEGPVVNADGRDDVVTDQAGVDDLLASLGF